MSDLYLPAGTTARGAYQVYVDPDTAGWSYSSLRVLDMPAGAKHEWSTGKSEWIVLPLSGGCTVRCGGETVELTGRDSVFAAVTDFAYVPRDADAWIASRAGGRVALAARASYPCVTARRRRCP